MPAALFDADFRRSAHLACLESLIGEQLFDPDVDVSFVTVELKALATERGVGAPRYSSSKTS